MMSAYYNRVYFVIEKLQLYCFFDWIKKVKIFDFFYSIKNNLLTSSNIIKVNMLYKHHLNETYSIYIL